MSNGADMITRVGDDDAERDFAELDLSELRFPSDSVSIATLRKIHPDLFDQGFFDNAAGEQPRFFFEPTKVHHADALADMIKMERYIATKSFAKSAGIPAPPVPDYNLEDELVALYVHFRVASGRHHAKELIQDVERQGAALGNSKQR